MWTSKGKTGFLPVSSLLLAATLWGLVWYPLRLLEQHGLIGLWTILVSYSAVILPALWLLGRYRAEIGKNPLIFLALALASGWCNVAFIMAVLEGTVVRVMLLFYLSPIWTVILGWLLLGERLSLRALGIFSVAMLGALIMLWDPEINTLWPGSNADVLALSSGFAFSLSNVLVRKMQHTPLAIKAALNWTGVLLVALVWLLLAEIHLPAVSQSVILGAVALGIGGFVVMTLAVQYGVSHMPVHRSAVILLFELVVGAISSLLLANELITYREWIGGIFVISATLLSTRVQEPEAQG